MTMRPSLLSQLPEVFRSRENEKLADFLKAYEKVLLGRPDIGTLPDLPFPDEDLKSLRGLEDILDDLPKHFQPLETPDDFLPWLSQWVALSVVLQRAVADNKERMRNFIAEMSKIYRSRGTKEGMARLLEIFTGKRVSIDDQIDGEPFCFKVMIYVSPSNEQRDMMLARAVINLEKPAHTRYRLIPAVPTMQIGKGWP
ncbi:MAG: phage tail protein, partial [Cyanobacteriota bacterium]